ncbi:MAG TPA: methyltransferase domain-containing protein [Vicinamibacterales bacterium]|nr:methyltransferase domain-containing protein [Vicinamibacterales bacterium]
MTTQTRFQRFAFAAVLSLALTPPVVAQRTAVANDTPRIFAALELEEGQTVGEIGAGAGEQTLDAARKVGATGKVYSSELGESGVDRLKRAVQASGLTQITVVEGDPNKTNFPDNCCDAIFMHNVYHHFADPAAMDASIFRALKPGGRVAVVDFTPNRNRPETARPQDRANDESHGVTPASVERELKAAGFEIVKSDPEQDRWFMVVGLKPKS